MSTNPSYSLSPIKGVLDTDSLLHLLRRTLFGVGYNDYYFFKGKTIEECLCIMLQQAVPRNPVLQGPSELKDPLVPEGRTWVSAPYENPILDNRRRLQLKMWWIENIVNRDYTLTEKMTLFWHNHFVTQIDVVKDSRYSYKYVAMLRANALGNFKKLIRTGITDPAMLVYLNGNANTKAAPNENFSRELMELFTLGKGMGVGYTEDDVKAAARVLSGWKDNKENIVSEFHPELHDTGNKHFSSYFDNETITGKEGAEGAGEIADLVNMIFKRKECAKFVCRNLYRWFVTGNVDQQAEANIITPLAEIFIQNNFNISPVLKTLLSSEHFFDPAFRGCIVKSPVDFFLGSMIQFDVISASNLKDNHDIWIDFYVHLGFMSMDIGNPPSVAGWPAYYQSPKFHQWWINSSSLSLRTKLLGDMCLYEKQIFNGVAFSFNFLPFAKAIQNSGNANNFINDCTRILFAIPISNKQIATLKSILNTDPDYDTTWNLLWQQYRNSPDNIEVMDSIIKRLRVFFRKLISLPEYQMT
jgi:hypothetical protein